MLHPSPVNPAQKPDTAVHPYPVRPLLTCANCDQTFFGTTLPDGTRAYRSRCGCRLHPLPAGQIEHRVYAETLQHLYNSGGGLLCDCLALLAGRLFTTVALGATTEDITFVPRT